MFTSFPAQAELTRPPRSTGAIVCWLFSGALLFTAAFVGHHTLWRDTCEQCGWNFFILASFVQEQQPPPAQIKLTVGIGVLTSALLASGLWRKLGPIALVPALVLLLSTCVIMLLCLRRNHALEAE